MESGENGTDYRSLAYIQARKNLKTGRSDTRFAGRRQTR
jgi:hypothetical protein